jgi:xanthine/uracil permease
VTEIPDASAAPTTSANLVYGLDDPILRPRATVIAFQHLLAMFVGTITPATIVAGALDLRRLQKAFSPVVAGTVVLLIGLLLIPTSL